MGNPRIRFFLKQKIEFEFENGSRSPAPPVAEFPLFCSVSVLYRLAAAITSWRSRQATRGTTRAARGARENSPQFSPKSC
jgi:hypothetical protein